MNNKWQKGIEELQNARLTNKEKDEILQKVLTRSPYAPVESKWVFVKEHVVVFSALLLVVFGSSVVLASEKSLPGNVLYPVKINVTEPARDLIKTVPAEKIEWQAEKATRRLVEAEQLSVENKLDDQKREEIEVLFDKHTEKFKKSSEEEIEKIEEKDKTSRVKEKAKKAVEKRLEDLKKAREKAFEKKDKN